MEEQNYFSAKRLKAIEEQVELLFEEFRKLKISDPNHIIFDNLDFMNLLKISSRTSKYWRDEGLITYSQVKGKVYFRLSDILELLEEHRFYKKR